MKVKLEEAERRVDNMMRKTKINGEEVSRQLTDKIDENKAL